MTTEHRPSASVVGLLCNCSMRKDPRETLSASIVNRAVLLAEHLGGDGIGVFVYSPRNVKADRDEVPGYDVVGHDLIATRRAVPRVNANWTYGTRKLLNKGMGYKRFKRWSRERGIGIFVPHEFSELVSNKLNAYQAVESHNPGLHPHTEDFDGTAEQIHRFFHAANLIFLKPRAGNKGNRIFVLRRDDAGDFSLTYYEAGERRMLSPITLVAALGMVEVAAQERRYVVQRGIDSLRIDGAIFDVRVVMVNDGEEWHSILETRLAPRGSDLSNIFQGGSIERTEELLAERVGPLRSRDLEQEIRGLSHALADHLGSLFPGQVMELGLDLVLDRDLGIHLVEVNAKPGVSGFGSEVKIFDWKPEDESAYAKSVRPHVRHLARFLRRKVEEV